MSKKTWIVVDVESDGPCPGLYSMVSLGAVVVERSLSQTFFAKFAPISDKWEPETLAISKIDRETHKSYPDVDDGMRAFAKWLDEVRDGGQLTFVSDNLAFDWQWVNSYFHLVLGENPFGFSGRRIGDLFAGMHKDATKASEWKKLRRTAHTHHPVDDAKGNAEAILAMVDMGLKIPGISEGGTP